MIYKEHYIQLVVNGNIVELEDQKSLNMRFNNVILDPTKISSTQASYSFEFEVPATPNNNRIFDYANNLAKTNKFHQRYDAEVYADGTVIFTGTIVVNGYSEGKYSLNLVSVKIYSLDDIFGNMTMSKIKWEIPFNGAGIDTYSINWYNDHNEGVTFPLVGYGVFQKSPINADDPLPEYTSKYIIDQYNRWYVESFYPSHNVLETLRKAFETKGYNVMGDAFTDTYMKNIYTSVNLADGQVPQYNLGNPKFGAVDISASITTSGNGYEQELRFPYFQVYASRTDPDLGTASETQYNFSKVQIYDILASGNTPTVAAPSYLYQPNEHLIVIPADGWYKIELSAQSTLNTTGQLTVKHYLVDKVDNTMHEADIQVTAGFGEITPIEIQLVRNYEDNLELIKGKENRKYINGNPNDDYYYISGRQYLNKFDWPTCYPHEDPYNSPLPTDKGDFNLRNTSNGGLGGERKETNRTSETSNVTQDEDGNYKSDNDDTSQSGNFSGRRSKTRGYASTFTNYNRNYGIGKLGYMYNDREMMAYDQAVSNNFICGLSSMSNGVPAVMKNGYSWSPIVSNKNESFAPVLGYSFASRDGDAITYSSTTHNQNTYINTPISYCNTTNTSLNGYVSCMVYLNKDDVLNLVAVQRGYENVAGNNVNYSTTTNVNLKITAFSDRTYDLLKASKCNRYDAPIEFSDKLNLANFLNREKKVSEWVQEVVDAFNIELTQEGKNIFLNTKKKSQDLLAAVDIDDRVNSYDAKSSMIEYPKSMAIKYKADTDEWGFERSAVIAAGGDESILNEDGWEKYGDSGYTVIELNDDSYVTSTSEKSLQFSYTWYQQYNWFPVNSEFQPATGARPLPLRVPIISKYSYMIDGYDYAESMKHDGYGLSQRFWFKPLRTEMYVWTRTYPAEIAYIFAPVNYSDGLNLSYKVTEPSLLKYFNIRAYLSSNYIEVDVYLNPDEYNRIKNGSLVHMDDDLYIPVEVNGYDPSGNNPTTLKLMKKVN